MKSALESSRSYYDQLIVADKGIDSTGSHEPTYGQPACSIHVRGPHHPSHGLPACSVQATGSATVQSRSTHLEPTRYGAHASLDTSYPRGVETLRGPHPSRQGLPTWSLLAATASSCATLAVHIVSFPRGKEGRLQENDNQDALRPGNRIRHRQGD